jgi:hypothetical protein
MNLPRFSSQEIAFLIAVPIAWAILLVFHPAVGEPVYDSLADDANAFYVVHVGMLLFLGLMGAALYLLVRDLPGTAARVARLSIGPFILFYAAGEAVLGIATGVVVKHGDGAPAEQAEGIAASAQALWDDFVASDLLIGLGGLAWMVGIVAAVVAYRRVGAPTPALVLLALSAFIAFHDPPIGPIALLCFAGAVAVLARAQRTRPAPEPAAPALAGQG